MSAMIIFSVSYYYRDGMNNDGQCKLNMVTMCARTDAEVNLYVLN